MLYSLPEYFNGAPLNESLGQFLYYLASAFINLKKGIINVDLPIAMGILSLFIVTSIQVLTGTGQGYSDSLSGNLSPVVAALLMPISSISVVGFATLCTRLIARKIL